MLQILRILKVFSFFMSNIKCFNLDRYDYVTFENFELAKKTFIREHETVNNLYRRRKTVYQEKHYLQNCILNDFSCKPNFDIPFHHRLYKNSNDIHFDIQSVSDYLNKIKFRLQFTWPHDHFDTIGLKHKKQYYQEYFHDISVDRTLYGAMKGLIMLQETYMQDIRNYSKGYLDVEEKIKQGSRRIDSLLPQDLAAMSIIAFTYMKWYDNSLQYIKTALDLFYSFSIKDRSQLPAQLEKTLLEMKTNYSSYHNYLFAQKPTHLGSDWKLFPYRVDEG